MAGISSKAAGSVENKLKYNGIELENDFEIQTYDAFFRELDPQTARWWQIDPKIESMEMWSPYASNYDNPIRYSDPLGDEPEDGGPGDPPSWSTRLLGAAKGIGGVLEMAAGAIGGAATSWTGIGAVAGGAVVVHGGDVAVAGFTQLFTGKSTQSFTEQGISNGLQAVGVSEQKANTVASYADAGLSTVFTAGASAVANSPKVLSKTNNLIGDTKSATSLSAKVNQPVPHAKQIKSIIHNASKPGVTLSDKKIDQLKRVIENVGGKVRTEVGKTGSVKGIKHSQVEHRGLGSKVSSRHIIHKNQQ